MNKRGFFLAEETLKIIIAVICIGFLIFILGKMYYSYTVDKDLQKAKDTLAYIEKEVNSMKNGDIREIMIYNPKGWILVSFGEKEKLSSCKNGGCLCICKDSINPLKNTLIKKCEAKSSCASFSNEFVSNQRVDLKNLPLSLEIKKNNNGISFSKK